MSERRYKLGFVGCGHMGLAIARGAKQKGFLKAEEISVYDPNEKTIQICQEEGFAVLLSEKEVADTAEVTLLAVTPQICDSVLSSLKGASFHTLLSIVTGVSIQHLQDALGSIPVIRAMPNTPLQVLQGSCALCRSENCSDDAYAFVNELFQAMGKVREIPEEQMEEMVCVHGSIPAYVYYLTECILSDMVQRGIDETAARELLVQTVIGSGCLMMEKPDKPLSLFIDEVCSKGGTTIQAITSLKEEGFADLIHNANEKCIRRAKELGK